MPDETVLVRRSAYQRLFFERCWAGQLSQGVVSILCPQRSFLEDPSVKLIGQGESG